MQAAAYADCHRSVRITCHDEKERPFRRLRISGNIADYGTPNATLSWPTSSLRSQQILFLRCFFSRKQCWLLLSNVAVFIQLQPNVQCTTTDSTTQLALSLHQFHSKLKTFLFNLLFCLHQILSVDRSLDLANIMSITVFISLSFSLCSSFSPRSFTPVSGNKPPSVISACCQDLYRHSKSPPPTHPHYVCQVEQLLSLLILLHIQWPSFRCRKAHRGGP